jgi:hypothetical protein
MLILVRVWSKISSALKRLGFRSHNFFTVEVLTLTGLITYYVLFFIHLESRRICLAGVTRHPDQEWMEQMARNVTMEDFGFLINRRYLLHDRDSKYCSSFRQIIEAGSVKPKSYPPARSPVWSTTGRFSLKPIRQTRKSMGADLAAHFSLRPSRF